MGGQYDEATHLSLFENKKSVLKRIRFFLEKVDTTELTEAAKK